MVQERDSWCAGSSGASTARDVGRPRVDRHYLSVHHHHLRGVPRGRLADARFDARRKPRASVQSQGERDNSRSPKSVIVHGIHLFIDVWQAAKCALAPCYQFCGDHEAVSDAAHAD